MYVTVPKNIRTASRRPQLVNAEHGNYILDCSSAGSQLLYSQHSSSGAGYLATKGQTNERYFNLKGVSHSCSNITVLHRAYVTPKWHVIKISSCVLVRMHYHFIRTCSSERARTHANTHECCNICSPVCLRIYVFLFWLEPSSSVIQYKHQLKDYSIQSENKK
jgi:hypothetical protein